MKKDGIWLEVSRVRIESKNVSIQMVGDMSDKSDHDPPGWWSVDDKAAGADAAATFRAIARGLDSSDQVVLAKLESAEAKIKGDRPDLECRFIRIQTQGP